jgi:hypothetical protein
MIEALEAAGDQIDSRFGTIRGDFRIQCHMCLLPRASDPALTDCFIEPQHYGSGDRGENAEVDLGRDMKVIAKQVRWTRMEISLVIKDQTLEHNNCYTQREKRCSREPDRAQLSLFR